MNRAALIVSSNEDISVPLWHALERAGVRAETVPGGPQLDQILGERLENARDCDWAVIVDSSDARHQGPETIRQLREGFPGLFVVAALALPGVVTTQAVVEAGAWDYLVHPFDEEQIKAFLGLWGETPAPAPSGRMVCFLPARAGDGASTVALHVAEAAIHERRERGFGGRVLLTDMDFQAGAVAFRLQLAAERTLADALAATKPAPGVARQRWADWVAPWRQLDILAAPPPGVSIDADGLGRTAALMDSAKARYPFVVCDMPPAIHKSSREVLALADDVYVVCTPEITSLHFARRRIEELRKAGVEPANVRLVVNRTGSHAWIGSDEVAQVVGLPVSARLANDYAGLNAAILQGDVVGGRSPLGRQFRELTKQALGVCARAVAA